MADNSNDAMQIFDTLKLTLMIVIPLGILVALIFHFKSRADREVQQGIIDHDLLKEQMAQVAKQRLAEREGLESNSQTVKLSPEEIRKKIESENEDFPEFNPIIPLLDLEEELESMENADENL